MIISERLRPPQIAIYLCSKLARRPLQSPPNVSQDTTLYDPTMILSQDAVPYVRLCMVYIAVLAAHVAFTPPARPQTNDGPKSGKKRDSITRASSWHPIFMKVRS